MAFMVKDGSRLYYEDAGGSGPTVLFLHGAGETKPQKEGKSSKMPVEVGIGPAIKKQEKSFPFITIIPQAQTRGWGATTDNGKMAMAILDEVMKEYKSDPKRVYLTGVSMGGAGAWYMARHRRFAAVVPVCGEVVRQPNDPFPGAPPPDLARILSAPVLDIAQAINHPQIKARGAMQNVPHPGIGPVALPKSPFRFSETTVEIRRRAPLLGEHNESVLSRYLGYSAEKIAFLTQGGVLVQEALVDELRQRGEIS